MRNLSRPVVWAALFLPACTLAGSAQPRVGTGKPADAHFARQLKQAAGHNVSRPARGSQAARPKQKVLRPLAAKGGVAHGVRHAPPEQLPVGGVPAGVLQQRRPKPFSRVKSGLGDAAIAQASRSVLPSTDFAYMATGEEWAVLILSSLALIALELAGFDELISSLLLRNVLRLALWVALAIGYSCLVVYWSGWESGYLWADGYLLDWALSFDNLFAFHIVLSYFKVPGILQRKAIVYGVMGAVVCRILFYLMFSAVLQMLTWCQPLCGIFLIYTALCTLRDDDDDMDVSDVMFVKSSQTILGSRLDSGYDTEGQGLFRWSEAGLKVTPLCLCVVVLWVVDTIFAIDSVSAKVVEIPSQFLACSSSMLALLGMGAMYPLLQDIVDCASALKYAVAAILFLIGTQLIVSRWLSVPAGVSLGVIAVVIAVALVGSMVTAWRSA